MSLHEGIFCNVLNLPKAHQANRLHAEKHYLSLKVWVECKSMVKSKSIDFMQRSITSHWKSEYNARCRLHEQVVIWLLYVGELDLHQLKPMQVPCKRMKVFQQGARIGEVTPLLVTTDTPHFTCGFCNTAGQKWILHWWFLAQHWILWTTGRCLQKQEWIRVHHTNQSVSHLGLPEIRLVMSWRRDARPHFAPKCPITLRRMN